MVEVMTDKATVEIPSPRAGTIAKIMFGEGQICPVGKTLVAIDTGVAAATEPTGHGGHMAGGHAGHIKPTAAPMRPCSRGRDRGRGPGVLATPATRQLARELGVDVGSVRGTGPGGRVTADDVRSHDGAAARPAQPAAREPAPVRAPSQPVSIPVGQAEERIPFRGVRRKIAENMARSKHTAAHFTYVEEIDFTELVALRERAQARAEERQLKLSYLPFIVKAMVAGLKKFPI